MASYMPAGFEDSDEDGFQSGDEDYSKYNCAPASHHELTESSQSQSQAVAGGGFPTFSQPRAWSKRRAEPSINAEDLKMAITQGNTKAVTDILDKGMDVNVEFPTGWTALMYAGNCGHTHIFKQLLERGANPAYHKDLYTVLMAVCGASGQKMDAVKECVKLLIDKKVDVNCRDRHHMTALMFAAREGCKEIVQLLLDSGAEMDRQDSRGWTALSWATHRGKLGVVKLLLERGADQHKQHADGLTAIDMARGKEQIVWLFEGKSSGTGAGEGDGGAIAAAAASAAASTHISKGSDKLKYGDLEMFLFGLQLGQLYPLFLAHHVDFPLLLTLTEQDLASMGVKEVGLRLKLMEGIAAVHKRNWETSSLVPIRTRSQVKCPDAIAIVANLSTHLRYITSSATYIKHNVKKTPQFMAFAQESADPRQLLLHTGDALKNARQLHTELRELHSALSAELGSGDYATPDRLPEPTVRRWVMPSGIKLALIGAAVFAVASLAYKRDNAMENARDFINRWQVKMGHAWLRYYY